MRWKAVSRAQDLGFDTVLTAPLFLPGSDDDLFLTADHEHAQVTPRLLKRSSTPRRARARGPNRAASQPCVDDRWD
jgi:hypothetical protein